MPQARPFLDFLREHRKGATHDELSDALQELVGTVVEEGKSGKLTLVITVKPAENGDGALIVSDEIKVAMPKRTKSGTIFFASPENNLVRDDPKQTKLDLREISAGGGEAREISLPSSVGKALA